MTPHKRTAPGAVLTGAVRQSLVDQDGVLADVRSKGIEVDAMESTRAYAGVSCDDGCMTVRYLSLQGVADHLGVSRNSVKKYNLPEPDVIVGEGLNAPRGWSEQTIDTWNGSRPGKGWRKREEEPASV